MATTGKNDAGLALVGCQSQGPPNNAPVVHFTPSRSRYQFILLGDQRQMCVNNLSRVAPSSGTAGNQTRDLLITNPTPYHYDTKPPSDSSVV